MCWCVCVRVRAWRAGGVHAGICVFRGDYRAQGLAAAARLQLPNPSSRELQRINSNVLDIWKVAEVCAHEHQRDHEKDSRLYLDYSIRARREPSTPASQRPYGLAKDFHRPLEVQLGIGGVGQAVPRMDHHCELGCMQAVQTSELRRRIRQLSLSLRMSRLKSSIK